MIGVAMAAELIRRRGASARTVGAIVFASVLLVATTGVLLTHHEAALIRRSVSMSNLMKKTLVLCACIVLCSAVTATATSLSSTGMPGTLTYNRIADGSLDELDVYVSTLTGGVSDVNGVTGTFTGIGGTISLDSVTSKWISRATNSWGTAPDSYVNLDTTIAGDFSRGAQSSGTAYSTFTGTWYTTSAPVSSTAGSNLLGSFWVTAGAGLSYSGQFSFDTGASPTVTFTTASATPEPSTLLLLASGLIGLAAYAWRKRK
jgi:hypothetical protein